MGNHIILLLVWRDETSGDVPHVTASSGRGHREFQGRGRRCIRLNVIVQLPGWKEEKKREKIQAYERQLRKKEIPITQLKHANKITTVR